MFNFFSAKNAKLRFADYLEVSEQFYLASKQRVAFSYVTVCEVAWHCKLSVRRSCYLNAVNFANISSD